MPSGVSTSAVNAPTCAPHQASSVWMSAACSVLGSSSQSTWTPDSTKREHVADAVERAQAVDAQGDVGALRRPDRALQPAEDLAARLALALGMDRVLEVDADEVGAGGHRLGEALDLLAGDKEHRTGLAAGHRRLGRRSNVRTLCETGTWRRQAPMASFRAAAASASRSSGWAIAISRRARSPRLAWRRSALPYSVTTMSASAAATVAGPDRRATMRAAPGLGRRRRAPAGATAAR